MRAAVLILCLLPALLRAQTARIDSLRRELYGSGEPQVRLRALGGLYEEYQSLQQDSLWHYAALGLALSRPSGTALDYERANLARIEAYLRGGNTDSALALVNAALPRNPVTDPRRRPVWYRLAGQKVDCYGDATRYEEALAELYRIIRYAEQYRDSAVIVRHMNTIGVINYNLDHVPEAFRWQFRALGWAGAGPAFTREVAACYINLGEFYWWIGRNDSASWYIDRAIASCRALGNLFYLCNAYRVKSSVEQELKHFAAAESYLRQAVALRSQLDGGLPRSSEAIALAMLYRKQGKFDASIALLLEGLAQQQRPSLRGSGRGADMLRVSYLNSLAQSYGAAGRYREQVGALQDFIRARDTLYGQNSAKATAELEARYELQKKETTIAKQKLDLVRQNYLLYGGITIALILITAGAILFINYRRQQAYRLEQLMAAEKLASRQAVLEAREAERSRISADLHDNLGAYAASIASNIDQLALQASSPALEELRHNSRGMVAQLADTIWVLKKDALSLTAVSDRLKVFLQRIQPSHPGVQIDVEEAIARDLMLPAAQAFQLFRILQEGITNALRHSGARLIRIVFRTGRSWRLSIIDNGAGMPADLVPGNGLESMRRRAADAGWSIGWTPAPDGGTCVEIRPGSANPLQA